MKYLPHGITIVFLVMAALAILGVVPYMALLRGVGIVVCAVLILLVVEAAAMSREIRRRASHTPSDTVTVIATGLIREGDVCSVDLKVRTVERAPS